jgi:hypothetical protein
MTAVQTAERLYRDLAEGGASEQVAARTADYAIAYGIAKRRLEKKKIRRNPTEAEVDRILWSM